MNAKPVGRRPMTGELPNARRRVVRLHDATATPGFCSCIERKDRSLSFLAAHILESTRLYRAPIHHRR